GYGKSWMVQRLLERIAQQDLTTGHKTEVVRLNLRKAMSPPPASLEALLMSLLRDMLEQLGVERLEALLARASKVPGDAKRKFRRALEQHVLSRGAHRSLIILEEADHLHRTPLQTDFFALLRAMAEDKTPVYKSLRLLVTIGAEAAFLETTDHSAFFALSKPIVLDGFSFAQLQSEAALYGLSPDDHGLRELHRLTSGYPQYAQQAMHEAVCSEKTLAEVLTTTDPRGGLFASSLQRLRLYLEREGLRPVLQMLLATPRLELPPNDYLRLYRKGLVMETSPGEYRLRCPLFDDYFRAWCR
nr:AAA-like domain-containing protein [Pseudomonadota bacterium]